MDETEERANTEGEVASNTDRAHRTESDMQSGYPLQSGWLTKLLAHRPSDLATNAADLGFPLSEDGHGATRGSDALILRILDEAASRRPPRGLFDTSEFDLPPGSTPVASAPPDSASNPQSSGADALVQRLLDDAASRRAPIGLFNVGGEHHPSQRPSAREFAVPPRYWSPSRFQDTPEHRAAIEKNMKQWGRYAVGNMAAPLVVESVPAAAKFVAENGSTLWDLGELAVENLGAETGYHVPWDKIRLPPYTHGQRRTPYAYPPGPGGLHPPKPWW